MLRDPPERRREQEQAPDSVGGAEVGKAGEVSRWQPHEDEDFARFDEAEQI